MPADVICGRNRHAEHKVDNDTLINEQSVKMLSKIKNAKKNFGFSTRGYCILSSYLPTYLPDFIFFVRLFIAFVSYDSLCLLWYICAISNSE